MPGDPLIEALTAVGLNRYESAVYLALVRSERMTASQVAARSRVPRSRVYDILADLARKGLVTEKIGKQRCFGAVDPAIAFPTLIREHKRQQALQNEQLAQTVKDLIARARPLYTEANPENGAVGRVRILSDPARLANHVTALVDQSEKRIACLFTHDFPPSDCWHVLARAAERLSLQCLCERRSLENAPLKETLLPLTHAGAEIRLSDEPLFPCMIFDERVVVFSPGTQSLDIPAEPIAHFLQSAFDSYWVQATPFEAMSEKTMSTRPIQRAPRDARERLLEAFQLGQPDPIPATWLGGGIWTINHAGHTFTSLIGRPQEMARALIDTFERTENPIVFVGSGYNIFQLAPFGAKIQFHLVGHLDLAKPLVKDADELDAFDVNALAREPAIQTIWETARIVADEIGEQALVAATAWGPFNLAAHILGIENLTRALYKNPAQVEKTVAFATRVIKKFYEPLLAERIIPLVSIADTIAGDHLSRAHFAQFVLPSLQDLIGWAKSQDALVLLHICGALKDKLDVLVETGANCVSLDSRVDLKRAKELFAGRVCIAGNLDPVNVLDRLTAREVEAAARECLLAGAGGGFVLMPGCDLPPTVSLDNVRAMLRAAEMWQSPITNLQLPISEATNG